MTNDKWKMENDCASLWLSLARRWSRLGNLLKDFRRYELIKRARVRIRPFLLPLPLSLPLPLPLMSWSSLSRVAALKFGFLNRGPWLHPRRRHASHFYVGVGQPQSRAL